MVKNVYFVRLSKPSYYNKQFLNPLYLSGHLPNTARQNFKFITLIIWFYGPRFYEIFIENNKNKILIKRWCVRIYQGVVYFLQNCNKTLFGTNKII